MTDHHRARAGKRRPWIPEMLADRYEVEHELGAGAAAVTVAAQDQRLGRRVAVKILKPEEDRDQEFSRRFTREARAAAAISHPNVVSIFDVGQEGELLYLVMQYVDGTDLKALIERQGALPWARAVAIARDVLAGLVPIHEAGIVHRDIKPQNVLIGRDGEVKVTDFGVAHVELDAALTTAGTTVGTASYMAPEQAQGRTPSPAADVYAVGVMLYEMVTGRLPFNEPTSVAVMLAHIQQDAPPPVAPSGMEPIPEGVLDVIRQAMAKDPNSRFRSATAMRKALERPRSMGEATATAGRTEVVPAVQRNRQATSSRSVAGLPSRSAPRSRVEPVERRGFGARFAAVLVVLALALAVTAGALWVIEERPNLFAGTGGSDEDPTATLAAPTVAPTPTSEGPAVIEPIGGDDPTPTPTPMSEPSPTPTTEPPPTPTPTAEPSPTPTVPVIVPVEETPPVPSPEVEDSQIIEPIEQGTIPVEPEG